MRARIWLLVLVCLRVLRPAASCDAAPASASDFFGLQRHSSASCSPAANTTTRRRTISGRVSLFLTIMGRAEPPRTMKRRLAPDPSLTPTLSRRARERTRCANFIVRACWRICAPTSGTPRKGGLRTLVRIWRYPMPVSIRGIVCPLLPILNAPAEP